VGKGRLQARVVERRKVKEGDVNRNLPKVSVTNNHAIVANYRNLLDSYNLAISSHCSSIVPTTATASISTLPAYKNKIN
jgi:hypothetical protein